MEQLEALKASSVAMADAVNYNRWTFDNIKEYLGQHILEVGAGIGSITEQMARAHQVTTLDNSSASVSFLEQRFANNADVLVHYGDICDAAVVAAFTDSNKINTIVCMNVLEHIEDDILALSHMRKLLQPSSGNLVLLVPAFQFLYGSIDAEGGHYRRYSARELREKLEAAGFSLRKQFYMNSLGVLGWFITCRVIREKNITGTSVKMQATTYDKLVVPFLSKFESMISVPFGLSIICICDVAE